MRYYKQMYAVLLALSISFVLLIEGIFLANELNSSNQAFMRFLSNTAGNLSGYTDFRLSSVAQSSMLLKVSEYTEQYIRNVPDINYVHLKMFQFVSGIFGVAPTQQNAIAISKLNDDYVIMNSGTGDIRTFLSRFHISQEQMNGAIDYFKKNVGEPSLLLTGKDSGGQKYYTVVNREWLGHPLPLFLFVSFSENKLFDLSGLSGGTFALIYKNQAIATAGQYSPQQIQQMLDANRYPAAMARQTHSSAVPGYQYLFLVKKPGFLTTSFFLIVAAGLIVLACAIFMAKTITGRLYLPIAELLNLTDDPITSGDDIAYIKKKILTLNSAVQSMSGSLEKYGRLLESKLLQDLLLNHLSQEQIRQEPALAGLQALPGPFVAVIVQYNQFSKTNSDLSQDMVYFLKQNLTNTIQSKLAPAFRFYRIIDMSFDTQAIVLQCGDVSILKDLLKDTLLKEESVNDLDFTAAIGNCCPCLDELMVSYRQAVRLLEMNEYLRIGAKVLSDTDVPDTDHRNTVYYPLASEQTLISSLIHGKTTTWRGVIDDIIATNQNEREVNLQQLCLMFTASLTRILDTLRMQADDVYGKGMILYSEFRSCDTFDKLHRKTLEMLDVLAQRIMSEQKPLNPSIMKKMLQFIDENSHRDISLLDLADYLNLSRNYVSTLFKDATGSNFKDFLNKRRYEMACAIIRENPAKRLKDVAPLVGCSTDILIRLFMRYGGVRPHEYQRQVMNGTDR